MARLESRKDLTVEEAVALLPDKVYLNAYQSGKGFSVTTVFSRPVVLSMIARDRTAVAEAGAQEHGFGLVIEGHGVDVYVETKKN